MIVVKTNTEIASMKRAGQISAKALQVGGEAIKAGATTKEVDTAIHDYIVSEGAVPSFLGYGGFPGSACISINDEVIHGIPGKKVIQKGDIVSLDVGAEFEGFHGDNAYTFAVGEVSEKTQLLLDVTKKSLELGIEQAVVGARIGDISHAIESYVNKFGFGVVTNYVGHGVGRSLHEDPQVPNFGRPGRGPRLVAGMTIAIEPMINAGTADVVVLEDQWTVVTADGEMSAHFEHTIAVTESGPKILTLV